MNYQINEINAYRSDVNKPAEYILYIIAEYVSMSV